MALEVVGVEGDAGLRRKWAKKFAGLFGAGCRLHPGTEGTEREWTGDEDDQLWVLLDGVGEDGTPKWADWAEFFVGRSWAQLRNHARKLTGTRLGHRRVYGEGSSARCGARTGDKGLTFQAVPDTSHLLSHMGLMKAGLTYSTHWRCCSGHGQNSTKPLAASNIPSRASSSKRPLPSPALNERAKKRADNTPSPSKREAQKGASLPPPLDPHTPP
jgi:hypothetical protein